MTLCNMSIEAGGRCGVVAPDATTFAYLNARPYAPEGRRFRPGGRSMVRNSPPMTTPFSTAKLRLMPARSCRSLHGARHRTMPCLLTPERPTLPAKLIPTRAKYVREALDYMGIAPGTKLTDIAVDRVFIGSCTNARIEDLRAAAAVLAGRISKVPGLVSPGSSTVKRQAEDEGLDRIFRDAGLEWADSGCSMCVGINGDLVPSGERCASTTNRNFRGRQGPGARTHLMSPAMVAAAAVSGHLADVRPLLAGRKL